MLVISWATKALDLGATMAYCERCQRKCTHDLFLEYRVMGVMFIFNFCGEKRCYMRCAKCAHETPRDVAAIERQYPEAKIPALDRYGCAVFVVGFCILVLLITCLASP